MAVPPVRALRLVGAATCVCITLAGGLWCGAATVQAAQASGADPYRGLESFAEALHTIEQRHVDPIPTEVLLRGAIQGMTAALDAHSQ